MFRCLTDEFELEYKFSDSDVYFIMTGERNYHGAPIKLNIRIYKGNINNWHATDPFSGEWNNIGGD